MFNREFFDIWIVKFDSAVNELRKQGDFRAFQMQWYISDAAQKIRLIEIYNLIAQALKTITYFIPNDQSLSCTHHNQAEFSRSCVAENATSPGHLMFRGGEMQLIWTDRASWELFCMFAGDSLDGF